ncbi:hypothetical protein ASPZODRAFT_369539 [Penicilliopsis zonata CBS 506.65]|uniref:Uncharacterized protein n=1 Tax=Penicilliopsis zonata CBS 506.65 TaxID=1073090 RepID=A0A1L9SVW6_9EURO|nr:hypothetical protein ASPZODRAFT_369539 [Penicilliopsis zonata CBS 506.65]OJJ51355.1 hypothetical protein ASPZODRAFT_369539 [Penicilliopsis zonata CBS 506.65]
MSLNRERREKAEAEAEEERGERGGTAEREEGVGGGGGAGRGDRRSIYGDWYRLNGTSSRSIFPCLYGLSWRVATGPRVCCESPRGLLLAETCPLWTAPSRAAERGFWSNGRDRFQHLAKEAQFK